MATVKRLPAEYFRFRAQEQFGQGRQNQSAEIVTLGTLWCFLSFAGAMFVGATQASAQLVVPAQTFAAEPEQIQSAPVPTDQAERNLGNGSGQSAQPQDSAGATNASSDESLPGASPERVEESLLSREYLQVADVVASVYQAFPVIQQARLERSRAQGLITEAYGAFDTKLEGYSLSEPTGFYENSRSGINLARQTWWGGYLSAGYRIGRGDFQPWYKERETQKGGEFKLTYIFPLLQGRAIDAQRLFVFQAGLERQAAEPRIQQAILDSSRDAIQAYWEWVAAGAVLKAQEELLTLAQRRGTQFEVGVAAGKFAEIDMILNNQLIAERQGLNLESQQRFQAASFKLSMYLRNEFGAPLVPSSSWLPDVFPAIEPLPQSNFQEDLSNALARRPEPRLLQLEMRQLQLELQWANNQLLPRLDVVTEGSQDTGDPASSTNDKGQFELLVGLQGEVPIQRRKARGKIQSTSAKIGQVNQKLQLQQDKIGVELQTAYNALTLNAQQVAQAKIALEAAYDTLTRYRFAFERGKSDLIYINLLETKANETEIKLIAAQRYWFSALAEMQAALGLDPLDQSLQVSALPPSELPGPGHLPSPKIQQDTLQKDWELHEQSSDLPSGDTADEGEEE